MDDKTSKIKDKDFKRTDPKAENLRKMEQIIYELKLESEDYLELLREFKKGLCAICHNLLEDQKGEFLVCPVCNKGGHKNHIETWFESNENCPACNSSIDRQKLILLKD